MFFWFPTGPLGIAPVFHLDEVVTAVPRLFTPEIASFYEGYYEAKGIKVYKGRLAAAIVQQDAEPKRVSDVQEGDLSMVPVWKYQF
jgi:hypothetical protein